MLGVRDGGGGGGMVDTEVATASEMKACTEAETVAPQAAARVVAVRARRRWGWREGDGSDGG